MPESMSSAEIDLLRERKVPEPMSVDVAAVYDFAKKLARQAGAGIKAASEKRWQSADSSDADGSKINSVDLVTETDRAVEDLVRKAIAASYPDHKFIGEESADTNADLTAAPTWIVDPIDGTTNFVHGFSHCCISIGFTVDKKPTIGVIYNPFLDLLYEARTGHGAFCNGRKLPYSSRPAPLPDLGHALIAAEYGSLRGKDAMQKKANSFATLTADPKEWPNGAMCHSIRSIGSAALNYAYVAAGQLDMYMEIGCYSWDVCAGVVIATEAGGRCYGKGGRPMDDEGSVLMGRYYYVIRGVAPTETETAVQVQDRLAKDFYSRIQEWDV